MTPRWLVPCLLIWTTGAIAAALPYPPPPGLEGAVAALWADDPAAAVTRLTDAEPTLPTASQPAHDLLLGYAELLQGEGATALPRLCASIDAFPSIRSTVRLLAAQAALAAKQPATAAALLQSLLSDPNPRLIPVALRHLAAAQEALGQPTAAIDSLERYLKTGAEEFAAQAVFDQARLHEGLGHAVAAQSLYQRVWEEYPGDDLADEAARAQLRLAPRASIPRAGRDALLARVKRAAAGFHHEAVIHTIQLLLRRAPDAAPRDRIDLLLGKAQFYRRDFAHAAATFRRAVRRDPDSPLAAELLHREAEARLRVGERTRAATVIDTLVRRFPSDRETGAALYMLGKNHHLRGNLGEARRRLRQLDQLQPTGASTDDALLRLGWIAYEEQDWQAARHRFNTLVERYGFTSDHRIEALYWAGRCAERLGDPDAARRDYRRTLAPNRWDYFSQEAAHRLTLLGEPEAEQSFHLIARSDARPVPPPSPYLERARLLASLGLRDQAQGEIGYAVYADKIPTDARLSYLLLLSELGGHDLSLTKLRRQYGKAMIRGDQELPTAVWRAVYPLPERPLLEREAARYGVDPYLLASLINQESAHDPRAYSPAGAHGLMQLIWPTARRVASRLNLALTDRQQLFDPEINLRLGVRYFADLLDMFDGNTAAALAAYNAGERRVTQWLAAHPDSDTPEFIATIPFRETRGYVERVLSHYGAYRAIYDPPPGDGATVDEKHVAPAPPLG